MPRRLLLGKVCLMISQIKPITKCICNDISTHIQLKATDTGSSFLQSITIRLYLSYYVFPLLLVVTVLLNVIRTKMGIVNAVMETQILLAPCTANKTFVAAIYIATHVVVAIEAELCGCHKSWWPFIHIPSGKPRIFNKITKPWR